VDNVWDFLKLKHKERDNPANLKLEVSKLINNVSSSAPDFIFEIKQQYTFEEVQTITKNATQNLKTHVMKTLFINKLAPFYKDYLLSQEPKSLNDATNTARAIWKHKHPAGQLPKLQNLTMSPVTSALKIHSMDYQRIFILFHCQQVGIAAIFHAYTFLWYQRI
jgi:hypothetical protein